MGRRAGFFSGLILGVLLGAALLVAVLAIGFSRLPDWLVVDQKPSQVDAIVVLGGGGGSRLKRGLELQDTQSQVPLILVGRKASDWQRNASNCGTCDLTNRNLVFLSESKDTASDADLVAKWSMQQSIGRVMIVTDPYHTRRADIVFNRALPGVIVNTVSSGYYGALRRPDEQWWRDRRTLETVWEEVGKIVYVMVNEAVNGEW